MGRTCCPLPRCKPRVSKFVLDLCTEFAKQWMHCILVLAFFFTERYCFLPFIVLSLCLYSFSRSVSSTPSKSRSIQSESCSKWHFFLTLSSYWTRLSITWLWYFSGDQINLFAKGFNQLQYFAPQYTIHKSALSENRWLSDPFASCDWRTSFLYSRPFFFPHPLPGCVLIVSRPIKRPDKIK